MIKKLDFSELLSKGPVILDGATGTNLQKAGLPTGVCPEAWIYDNPDAILNLQKDYVKVGTQILYAPTFTANRIKLEEFGLGSRLSDINRRMVRLSREAAGESAFVAGDLTMTGRQLYPIGDLDFEELVDIYKEQVGAILEEGVDLFVIETMMSLQECRAGLLAVKETCDLPVMVSLTYNEDGRTLFGSLPDTTIIVLQEMGADVVGINCSTGPEAMLDPLIKMRKYAKIPILIKPNAGLPVLENGETVYKMDPDEFADAMVSLVEAGASVVGGCCGTTPEHIKALCDRINGMTVLPPEPEVFSVLTSERKNVDISHDAPFLIIGERINPTGKKVLQEELRAGKMDIVNSFAREQEEDGASILDINMGTNGIDEKQSMIDAVYEVTSTVDLPLCIDSSYVDVVEAALRIYPGRALINSVSAESDKMTRLLPIARKYGAMFILLPLSDAGLPKTLEEKHDNIDTVLEHAISCGLDKRDAVVDILVSTIGADPQSAQKCFATVSYCKQTLGLPTVCGLSNISFGLPQRTFVNTAFFSIALSKGLTMAIANPSQEMLMYTALASDMLMDKDKATERYLNTVPSGNLTVSSSHEKKEKKQESLHPITEDVVQGRNSSIVDDVKKELEKGTEPSGIINEYLISGINLVGKYYEDKIYFLPQLIAGANAMKEAMDYLEPMLISDSNDQKETIVVATVEGDIHDIGKNLVVLMLKNYGYRVIDLGKDIPAEDIVSAAIREKAAVIGLSALMTTTMMRMKEVVEKAKEMNCTSRIVIGGACITESFADEIGADGYSRDAAECVKLVERILAKA